MLQVPVNGTGPIIDTLQPTTGKERQIASIGDPTTGAAVATVEVIANSTVGQAGAVVVASPATWSVASTPATGTAASASKATGGSGVQHVCRSISFALAVDGTHAQAAIQINLRDGAPGAGTILWSLTILKAAVEALSLFHVGDLNIPGSANTAMTLEFASAGATGSVQSVSITGYDI